MEGGDLSCVCVSELRTRSVCSVSRGVVQWPGRGSGTPGFHVWPCSAVCGLVWPRAVLYLLSLLSSVVAVECSCHIRVARICRVWYRVLFIYLIDRMRRWG